MLKRFLARTAGKNHRAVRAPSEKKTKNEVKKTKKLQILLSGICCGAGFSQCTFGHSQIRLQTSGHESFLARILKNWITFGNCLEIGNKKKQFLSMKNHYAVFLSRPRRYGRFFGRCRKPQNGGQKSPPKIRREMPNRMYFRNFR